MHLLLQNGNVRYENIQLVFLSQYFCKILYSYLDNNLHNVTDFQESKKIIVTLIQQGNKQLHPLQPKKISTVVLQK